ncbi:hypothetical protein FA95DRAFT_1553093 [Auriscalpium vulgare]|uniref:Uncharacterized protein n=1 Tax=Auriscalpium vulgare TaxID=40419 RepID=A0ACB8SA78_9AGAM|nr:hypothetical protein FA95DRAFT_1553093 [Auriscalpium vulgare]
MARLRPSPSSSLTPSYAPSQQLKPLRVLASGTVFFTHTLTIPSHPSPSSNVRANAYERSRNGSASTVLAVLAQFHADACWLVASLGGNDEGKEVIRELEKTGVSTRYCKIWEGAGVPGAWVLHANDTDSQAVINHNPLPDISHEEFISLLGPLLAPENYPAPPATPVTPSSPAYPASRPSLSAVNNNAPPFEWLHFEGRSVKTTLSNLIGIDGLARERRWRSQCVFSVDVGRRTRQGVEALIPHADVLFLNKHYAQAHSPAYASTPRAFLLSLTHSAPPHALLVAYWGKDGAAALSVPTREYFQSSGWVEETHPPPGAQTPSSPTSQRAPDADASGARGHGRGKDEILSVRSGSDFWAGPRGHSSTNGSTSMSAFSAALLNSSSSPGASMSLSAAAPSGHARGRGKEPERRGHREQALEEEDSDSDADSQGTEIAGSSNSNNGPANGAPHNSGERKTKDADVDEVGAQDAFVAGMIYALSRRLLPGAPYSPGLSSTDGAPATAAEGGKWRLDECLRFATELAGRKARRRGWKGLAAEMVQSGWFDT